MYNVETAQSIIIRARKSLNRRIRDGKKARPVQDPLIELASEQIQRIADQDAKIAELEALIAEFQRPIELIAD